MSEGFQELLDAQHASDEVLKNMCSLGEGHYAPWAKDRVCAEDSPHSSLPLGAPTRSAAVWMLGHLVEHVQLHEMRWLDALLLLDSYCLHRPDALERSTLPALCAAITRLVKKLDEGEPTECLSNLHNYVSSLAQWLQKSGYPHLDTCVTPEDLNREEGEVLCALRWNIKLPTVQDWMTVLCARLNVFTCSGLRHLLTPLWQHNFQMARLLATRCPSTAAFGARRTAQGLLCLSLVSAHVLPPATFGLCELATPVWEGAAGGQQQCKQESLEFLLDGLQAATGVDISSLQADAHLVNETLLILRMSTN